MKAAAVRQDGAIPTHELVEAAQRLHRLVAGAEVQVVGVAQLDLAAQLVPQVESVDAALDGGLGAHVHEHRRLYHAAVGTLELSPPGAALFFNDFEHTSLS